MLYIGMVFFEIILCEVCNISWIKDALEIKDSI